MSSANSLFFKFSKSYPIFKNIFLYYNIYIRNFKFFFHSSQFGEDKKIIKLFKEKRNGTYLDLGCFHPIRQNNTYLLHKLGWKGINIDLNPVSIELFNIARPKDINICMAISGKKGLKNLFFDHELSSLNTISKNHTLFLKEAFGIKTLKKKIIKTNTLNNILKENKIKKIDFMNIDIEGNELEVLKTLNFKNLDIKVICIEIVNYDIYSKNIKIHKKKIVTILKKNNYYLKFKTFVNYIFIKK
jgi:FkbM family methyltransferase